MPQEFVEIKEAALHAQLVQLLHGVYLYHVAAAIGLFTAAAARDSCTVIEFVHGLRVDLTEAQADRHACTPSYNFAELIDAGCS